MVRILDYVRSADIDLVHLNNGFENHEAHLASAIAGRRVLVHAHGPCGSGRLTRWLARRAEACVAVSRDVGASLISAGTHPDRLTVLPNPLTVSPAPPTEHDRALWRRTHRIPPHAVVIGIVGRLIQWKGQLEFLRAAAIALRSHPEAHAVVVGDVTDGGESYGESLQREVKHLGVADRVTFTGFIADPKVVYCLMDILVHSSLDPEPFGLVLTEAMANGLPVVGANRGGPLEIITDGYDGFLRDPLDIASVSATLSLLLGDATLRKLMGARARATALACFDPDQYVSRLAEVYCRILSKGLGHSDTTPGAQGGR